MRKTTTKQSINVTSAFLIGESTASKFHKETGLDRTATRLLLCVYNVSMASENKIVASSSIRSLLNFILPINNNGYTVGLKELEKRGLIERSIYYTNGNFKKLYICLTGLGVKVVNQFNQLYNSIVLINA